MKLKLRILGDHLEKPEELKEMIKIMSNKIVLFIVEGVTDKISLEMALTDYFDEKDKVRFKVIHGDITSDYKRNTSTTILEEIKTQVYKYLQKSRLKLTDISKVVQIVDTDGAYVRDTKVVYHGEDKIYYNSDKILTKYPEKIMIRNLVKSAILNKLNETNEIIFEGLKINYEIYFMSSNLDHVLHNNANLDDNFKIDKAESFADYYFEELQLEGFIDFLKQSMLDSNLGYKESWKSLEKENNSLIRHSNLYLFFKNK